MLAKTEDVKAKRSAAARKANETRSFDMIRRGENRLKKMGWHRRHPCVTWDHSDGRSLNLFR